MPEPQSPVPPQRPDPSADSSGNHQDSPHTHNIQDSGYDFGYQPPEKLAATPPGSEDLGAWPRSGPLYETVMDAGATLEALRAANPVPPGSVKTDDLDAKYEALCDGLGIVRRPSPPMEEMCDFVGYAPAFAKHRAPRWNDGCVRPADHDGEHLSLHGCTLVSSLARAKRKVWRPRPTHGRFSWFVLGLLSPERHLRQMLDHEAFDRAAILGRQIALQELLDELEPVDVDMDWYLPDAGDAK